jgi:hypothetical protein
VLVLRDVLGCSTAEVAEMLRKQQRVGQGALQRAPVRRWRRALPPATASVPLPNSPRECALVGRFADAVERGDIDSVVALLTDNARLAMPPEPRQYQGGAAIVAFLGEPASVRGTPCAWCLPAPTPSPRSAATCPCRARRSHASTGCWCHP